MPDRATVSRILPGTFRAWVVLALLASATGLRAQEPVHGPFRVGEQNPLYRFFHTPDAEGADLIPPGSVRIEGGLGYANIFEISQDPNHFQLLDMERLTSKVFLRWAPTDDWEVGGGIRTTTDWGGFLDPFVSGFHDFFGFPDGGRETVEDGEYSFFLLQKEERFTLRARQDRLALDDARLYVKRALVTADDGGGALSVRGILHVALGPSGADPGRADGAIELLGRRSLGRTNLHGGLGAMTLTAPGPLEVFSRERAYYLLAGVERLLTDRVSIVAQMVGGTGYFQGFGSEQVDGNPMNLIFGLAGSTSGGWGWQVSFAEDVPPGSPSPDFSLAFGLSRTVGRE